VLVLGRRSVPPMPEDAPEQAKKSAKGKKARLAK
jgi:hypothetical protein